MDKNKINWNVDYSRDSVTLRELYTSCNFSDAITAEFVRRKGSKDQYPIVEVERFVMRNRAWYEANVHSLWKTGSREGIGR